MHPKRTLQPKVKPIQIHNQNPTFRESHLKILKPQLFKYSKSQQPHKLRIDNHPISTLDFVPLLILILLGLNWYLSCPTSLLLSYVYFLIGSKMCKIWWLTGWAITKSVTLWLTLWVTFIFAYFLENFPLGKS